MSEPSQPRLSPAGRQDAPPQPRERPAQRYQRSSGGLVGALIVTVVAVLAFAGFRALTSRDHTTPVPAVDYAAQVRAGRADGKLKVWAPPSLPTGWKATSATYTSGVSPSWHLGMLTSAGKYVGVEESRRSLEDLVTEHVDADAAPGKDVVIGGETWHTWTDRGGDYAVGRDLRSGGQTVDSWLVVGSAPGQQIRDLAGRLEAGTSSPAG